MKRPDMIAAVAKWRKLHDERHSKMLADGFAVCKMCGSSYTRLPICGVCYDTLMKYKKAGRLPKRLVPFAMAAGLMKG